MKKLTLFLLILVCILTFSANAEIIGGADGATEITIENTLPDLTDAANSPEPTQTEGLPTQEIAPEPEQTEMLRLSGVVIGIDPGHQEHGNNEKEAISPDSSETKPKVSSGTSGVSTQIPEYKTNLTISLILREKLEALGCTVYMTRETNDVDISNQERATMMNEVQADLVLRLHCDGSNDRSVHGISMYVRETGEKAEESADAAKALLDSMAETTGSKARGVFKRDSYTGLNWSTVPSILVEMGFMSNPEEDEMLNDSDYQAKLVEGMVEGICVWLGR